MKTTFYKWSTIAALYMFTVSATAQTPNALRDTNQAAVSAAASKYYAAFDGIQTHAQTNLLTGNLEQATLMTWFKASAGMTTTSCLMGREGLVVELSPIENGYLLSVTVQNQTLSAPLRIVAGRWYQLTVVIDVQAAEKMQILLNGQQEAAAAFPTSALTATSQPFTLGMHPTQNNAFFKGGLDELRLFNAALPIQSIQKMIYQEIECAADIISGSTISKPIAGVVPSALKGYFRMDAFSGGLSPNRIAPEHPLHFIAMAGAQLQTAPLPFTSHQNGTLEEAFGTNDVCAADIRNHSWAIVRIGHDVQLTANQSTLGLFIDANASLTLSNNSKIENHGFLQLDGKLDLQGQAQLVQTKDSEIAGNGFLERDQLAQSNVYNYNYWGSPVGQTGPGNNNAFSPNAVLRDGTDAAHPAPIQWGDGLDGAPTSPITLSGFWIFTFQNQTPNYANWLTIGPYGTVLPGQGFTLKGSGAATTLQNLVFSGKPNNGLITSPMAPGHLNLAGNPYPSALDAHAFIKANKAIMNGTIYIWEHFAANNSHQLMDYQGGYATRNLVGGTPAVWKNSSDSASKQVPHRFLPVGQGFFVQATAGGFLQFDNDQRAFVKEDSKLSSGMFRMSQPVTFDPQYDNRDDEVAPDEFIRIRLGYDAPDDHHRQVLLGFMNENASANFESGYDALNIDTQPSDLYLLKGNAKLVIEGEGFFNEDLIYPLGVKTGIAGNITLKLDGIENLAAEQPIYIFDALTGLSHDIRNHNFTTTLPAGTLLNRFSLRFKADGALANDQFTAVPESLQLAYNRNDSMLSVACPSGTNLDQITIYDLPGQRVAHWDTTPQEHNMVKVPLAKMSSGTYIVQLRTANGMVTKKIVL